MIQEFYLPTSINEACQLKQKLGNSSLFIAGGTEINFRKDLCVEKVISLEKLGLDYIEVSENLLKIGSMAKLQDIVDSKKIDSIFDGIKKAALSFENIHLRNIATIGGNIGASYSFSIMIPMLIAYRAMLEIANEHGETCYISIEDYVYKSNKSLILSINLPKPADNFRFDTQKYSRTAFDFSTLQTAVSMNIKDGKANNPIVAIGYLGKHVYRLEEIEQMIPSISENYQWESLETLVSKLVEPIADIRGKADFKKYMAGVLVARSVRNCLERK